MSNYSPSGWGHILCEVPQVSMSQDQLKVKLRSNINTTPSLHTISVLAGWCGIESRWERDFPHTSRPALEPTQPPVQRVRCHSRR